MLLFQFDNQVPDGSGRVEVLGVELVDADLDAEGVVDLADDGDDVKRVEDTVVDELGLVVEIHIGADFL